MKKLLLISCYALCSAITPLPTHAQTVSPSLQQLSSSQIKSSTPARASILQTGIVPYIESQDSSNQIQSTNEVLLETQDQLATTEAELADAQSEIQSLIDNCSVSACESVLESTQDLLSQTDSLLESTQDVLDTTRVEFSATESILESTQDVLDTTRTELSDCDSILESTQDVLDTTRVEFSATESILESTQDILDTTRTELSNCDSILESTQDVLDTTRTEFSATESILESTQDVLDATRIELSNCDSILESTQDVLDTTRTEFSVTESILESTQDELVGANAEIDTAELLLSATAIPEASAIDTTLATLFSLAPYAGQNPDTPLVDRINDGLIPYLQASLAKLGEVNEITQIAAGYDHTVVLTSNGKVYATGNNLNGQLGIGTSDDYRTTLTAMIGEGTSGVTAIAAGNHHTIVLKDNGAVYGTGENGFGQLGIGNNDDKDTLTAMIGIGTSDVIAVAAGDNHTIVLKEGGAVYGTGRNIYGQLGIGTNGPETNKNTLTAMEGEGISAVTAIAAGGDHTIVLKGDVAYGTGANFDGQLGIGTSDDFKTTLTVMASPGNADVTAIAAGSYHTIVLKGDAAYGTGNNSYGQLGIGTNSDFKTTLTVMASPGDAGVTAIAAGSDHTIVLKGGAAYGTGANFSGRLGIGTSSGLKTILTPMVSPGDTGVTAIDAGGVFTIALKGGAAYGTGGNNYGQLGIGSTVDQDTLAEIAFIVKIENTPNSTSYYLLDTNN